MLDNDEDNILDKETKEFEEQEDGFEFYDIDLDNYNNSYGIEDNEFISEAEHQVINPVDKSFVPTIPTESPMKKFRNEKTIFAAVIIAVALIVVGVLGSYFIASSLTDVGAKSSVRDSEMNKLEKQFSKESKELFESLDIALSKDYNYDSYIKQLSKITLFRDKLESENWYNPYSDRTADYYNTTIANLESYKYKFTNKVAEDLKEDIDWFKLVDKVFEQDGSIPQDKLDPKYLISIDFCGSDVNKNTTSQVKSSELATSMLKDIDKTFANIIDNQNAYQIFTEDDFTKLVDLYHQYRNKIEKVYSSSLEKETNEEAKKEADKEFESKKDELKKSIEEEIVTKTTQEVTEKLDEKYSEQIDELKRENSKLKEDNASLESALKDINDKYNKLKEQQKSN